MTKESLAEYKKKWNRENKEKIAAYKREYYKVYNQLHKERLAQKAKEWNATHKEERYTQHLKRKYNLTREEYNLMLDEQDNCCACCGEPFIRTPNVDHDHTTGVVRGILCTSCNVGLGQYEKNHILFEKYLDKYSNITVEDIEEQ